MNINIGFQPTVPYQGLALQSNMMMQSMLGLMSMMMQVMTQGMMGGLTGGNGLHGLSGTPRFGTGSGLGGSPGLGGFLGAPSGGGRTGPKGSGAASRGNGGGGRGPVSSGPVAPGVNNMLDKARSMLGLHEGRNTAAINSITKKSGINAATTPWCAAFAMNLLKDHGVLNLDGLTNRNYCPTIEKWATDKGIYGKPGQYQPKPGDAIIFDWQRDGRSDHIGIVEKVENGKVYTIEGNSSDSVKRNVYPLNSGKIDGYVVTGTKKA